jgi:alkylation response protein AidB-like acyl-CoA dehydrogenase
MQFSDSETQRLLRSTARSFLANAYPWERLYRIESGDERMSEADVRELAGLGWFGLLLPESAGGGGASLLDAAAVIEEFGYAAVPSPVPAANIAAYLLSSAAAASDALAGLAHGDRLYTISEGTRRFAGGSTLSVSNGSVTGTLPLVPFADLSAYVLAPVTLDGEPAFVALPLRDAELEPVELLDRRCYANAQFRNAGATVLATGAQAQELHERCDALSTAFSLIELSGMMRRILEMTAQHISTRQQFGQPIGKFQAARHRAAEILTQVDTTRWAAYHALWRFQEDPRDTDEIWLAKHWAVRAVDRVFQNSHLLHGGVGVGMEHPLHLFTQGIAAFAVRAGTMSEMVQRTLQSLRSEPIAGAAR